MKIKSVCELTGLSDRTIRYYIEQELISPQYTENYLGRKTFEFSSEDIHKLNDIATLRKFDFTIQEIRDIIISPDNSKKIIFNIKNRIKKTITENDDKLSVLVLLDSWKAYTISELAEELNDPSSPLPVPDEESKRSVKETLLSTLKTVITFLIVWSPIFLSISIFIMQLRRYEYPRFTTDPSVYILIFLSLLPSISALIISKLNFSRKKSAKRRALVFCVLSLPFCFLLPIGTISHSETTDFRNYREFDAECPVSNSSFFQDFFPLHPRTAKDIKQPDGSLKTIHLDAHYYYRFIDIVDYTYDVYAEWPLEKDEFEQEVSRVKELFEENKPSEDSSSKYEVIEKGNYTCLMLYTSWGEDKPFESATDNYYYDIFAYDRESLKVRYIRCVSMENGADQPYYLKLEW